MSTHYHPLSPEQITHLRRPENTAPRRSWEDLTGGMHAVLSLRSRSFPRPFVDEEFARGEIARALQALRGTGFFAQALRNVHAMEQLDAVGTRFSPAASDGVDGMIVAILDEEAALTGGSGPSPRLASGVAASSH
jgi:hypothetical protein